MENISGFDAASAHCADLRLRRATMQLHDLPPRVIYELLREIGVAHGVLDDVVRRAQLYSTLTAEIIAAVGADRFPPALRRVA